MTKRLFDFLFSLIALIILSPFLISIALLIKLNSSGPIFFRQERVGRKGKIFRIYKFRTMIKQVDEKQEKIFTTGEDERVTCVGRFLRKWKIDEIPQLMNVLKGEMSLVGPRPEISRFIAFFPKEKREKILSLRPGLTSLSSVKFSREREILARSADPENDYIYKILPQKISLDLEYAEKQSFLTDILLIMKTIKKIFVC